MLFHTKLKIFIQWRQAFLEANKRLTRVRSEYYEYEGKVGISLMPNHGQNSIFGKQG